MCVCMDSCGGQEDRVCACRCLVCYSPGRCATHWPDDKLGLKLRPLNKPATHSPLTLDLTP